MSKVTNTSLVLGTDFQYPLHVQNGAETASIDITGWTISWMLKKNKSDADAAAIITKTTATSALAIAGTFNAMSATNTQRATLTLTDTDTASLNPGLYRYEFKRTDDGFETPLAEGLFELKHGVHR